MRWKATGRGWDALEVLPARPEWHTWAACRGAGPEVFYPPEGTAVSTTRAYEVAKKWCAGCPVRAQCREAGQSEAFGLWGGTTPSQRKGDRRRPLPPAALPARDETE